VALLSQRGGSGIEGGYQPVLPETLLKNVAGATPALIASNVEPLTETFVKLTVPRVAPSSASMP
jgi:hypothetical protein